jgi:lipopolysaccharide export LptBFGC system permease protein LptF
VLPLPTPKKTSNNKLKASIWHQFFFFVVVVVVVILAACFSFHFLSKTTSSKNFFAYFSL